MAPNDAMNGDQPRTLTILGCGTLGSAILFGLLSSRAHDALGKPLSDRPIDVKKEHGLPDGETHQSSLEDYEDIQKPTRFITCVRTPESADRLRRELALFKRPSPVNIVQGENARAVQAADIILLSCQPQDLVTCLGEPAVKKAMEGKLLISILAGVTIPQIDGVLNQPDPSRSTKTPNGNLRPTSIIRAMPNTASFVRSSTTVITSCSNATPSAIRLVEWLFNSIGTVTQVTPIQFDICTALCGSTPAFFALFIESLLDGAVALGLKRSEAQIMAAETMKGAAMLMLAGESPHAVKEKVATPGGSTVQGLLELERKAVRGTIADALIRCTAAASVLGSRQA
ncbi:MAG: hypothetical protein LQ343_003094 [Gyalolechia ehrenbergii]|nr:MAG: hypothetical protein LQ343_003094 [Gyalolechia ehrenbergii]